MKKIFVLYTGGTIGMIESEAGLHPDATLVETALQPFSGSLKFDWHICQPLIDSSAISPQHWATWLALLQEKLPHYDGILILHGTDTLAYTANFLALTLHTHNKPIILTGSQKPFSHPNSDAPANLQTAITALQRHDIHEVLLAFHGKLLPAIGSSKCSTEKDDGFSNTHFGVWQPNHLPTPPFSGSLKRNFQPQINIATCFLTPALPLSQWSALLQNHDLDGVIIMTYGHGNAPNDADFLHTMKQLIAQGKPILNISQVPQGCAAAVYAQGNALRQSGVINAGKCTIETACVLLMLAVSNNWQANDIQQELQRLHLIST